MTQVWYATAANVAGAGWMMVLSDVITLVTGAVCIVLGPARLPGGGPVPPSVDNEFRFLAAYWFTLGVVVYWLIPRIERATTPIRVIAAAVFLGGISRLTSLVAVGMPDPILAWFVPVDLIAPPLIVWWQAAVVRRLRRNMS